MATIVERAREVIAAEIDDFFQDDTILFYANQIQRKITSYMINQETVKKEPVMRKSLRALDKLRKTKNISVGTLTLTGVGAGPDYYKTEVPFPTAAGEEINQFLYLKYGDSTPLRELNTNELIKFDWSNLNPTKHEGYYHVTQNATDVIFELYLHEDTSGDVSPPDIRIYYITKPTDLTLASESLPELPEQLENAVIYGTAMEMIMQESVGNSESQSFQMFSQLYQEEIQANTY